MKKEGRLGKGIASIFAENYIEEVAQSSGVQTLKISEIEPKADQPRKYFDEEALNQLAESIKQHGLIQPIVVRESSGGFYQIVAGERRWRASKLAGLTEVPVIIIEADAMKAAELAIIENIQREDLNPYEEAQAYKSLMDNYSLTQEEVASKVGKSRSAVANTMRLLDLPDEVLTLVASKELSAGHARTILGLKNREDMILLAQRAIEADLSVRVLEEEVKRLNKPKKEEIVEEDEAVPVVDYFRELELRVQSRLGRRVKIDGKGRKKTITLSYEDNEDLDEILALLCGNDFLNEV